VGNLAALPVTAQQILTAFAEQLEEVSPEGYVVPQRQYVHAGAEAVWDGEQLTVGFVDLKQGQPGIPVSVTIPPRALLFYVEWKVLLLRSAPTVQEGPQMVPSADVLDESGGQSLEDVQALAKAFSNLHLGNVLTGVNEGFVLESITPVGPEGGLVGTELRLSMSVR
jgi:hypothetical protein